MSLSSDPYLSFSWCHGHPHPKQLAASTTSRVLGACSIVLAVFLLQPVCRSSPSSSIPNESLQQSGKGSRWPAVYLLCRHPQSQAQKSLDSSGQAGVLQRKSELPAPLLPLGEPWDHAGNDSQTPAQLTERNKVSLGVTVKTVSVCAR